MRDSPDRDHTVEHLEGELKGFNLQAGEPANVVELGKDVWCGIGGNSSVTGILDKINGSK